MTRNTSGGRPVVVVRAHTSDPVFHAGGPYYPDERRTDFMMVRDAVDGRFVDLDDVGRSWLARAVARAAGTYVALAVLAFRQRRHATAFVTGSENEAIVLALMLKLTRRHTPLVAVGQYPAKASKWPAWRLARVHTHMSRIMPLGTVQAERLVNGLGVPAEKVELLPYGIDTGYWSVERATPRPAARPYVFAAGLQHRDYATLVAAVDGLDADLVIAAASPWATTGNELEGRELPTWVTVEAPGLAELRDGYAGAAVVVTSLVETDFPAGSTVVLEAMAMGRPTVVSRAEGAGDLVADRRATLRRGPLRATSSSYAGRLAEPAVHGQTGFYFPPGDAEDLRGVLRWILEHGDEAAAVGARARLAVERVHTVEQYVARIAAAVLAATTD